MRYLSVCSGIEAATSAWHELGWKPVAFSEIEPFPSAVLKHHYPDVPKPDGLRYKALGNSMAVPCMNWIGKRISLSQQA